MLVEGLHQGGEKKICLLRYYRVTRTRNSSTVGDNIKYSTEQLAGWISTLLLYTKHGHSSLRLSCVYIHVVLEVNCITLTHKPVH